MRLIKSAFFNFFWFTAPCKTQFFFICRFYFCWCKKYEYVILCLSIRLKIVFIKFCGTCSLIESKIKSIFNARDCVQLVTLNLSCHLLFMYAFFEVQYVLNVITIYKTRRRFMSHGYLNYFSKTALLIMLYLNIMVFIWFTQSFFLNRLADDEMMNHHKQFCSLADSILYNTNKAQG